MAAAVTAAKKYDWTADIKRTKYIDLKDSRGVWSVGFIDEIRHANNSLSVRYDGWFDKYKEVSA